MIRTIMKGKILNLCFNSKYGKTLCDFYLIILSGIIGIK